MSSSPLEQLPPISMVKPILPRQGSLVPDLQPAMAVETTEDVPPPRRRGRKPGLLSRSAREAQRKLNHSIIEKARRTKINEALAALRQLVPADYTKKKDKDIKQSGVANSDAENEEDDEDEDGDGEYGAPWRNAVTGNKKNSGGKNSGGEFKLEVLERTVTYLQDLTKQRDDLQEQLQGMRQCRCREYEETIVSQPTNRKRSRSTPENSASDTTSETSTNERPAKRHSPLPPISSWLPLSPDSSADALPHGSKRMSMTPLMPPYLPTPPPSALFPPNRTPASPLSATSTKSSHIPSLSLGPTALPLPSSTTQATTTGNNHRQGVSRSPLAHLSSAGTEPCVQIQRIDTSPDLSPSSYHTPEDETAASLLLTMRLLGSPTIPKHVSATSPSMPTATPASMGLRRPSISDRNSALPSPSSFTLPPLERLPVSSAIPSQSVTMKSGKRERERVAAVPRYPVREDKMHDSQPVVVETPGSLLGLTGFRNKGRF
ncbi:hypothetical protein AX15_003856 [Amanita polypyramis BW_CC]|nr:hypothetical protein AX15_003856 [Amanita polypyramis BW_CC]